MAEWLIKHLDHNGNITDEFKPLNLNFTLAIDEADDISYDISLANPQMRWFLMGPRRTDYLLSRDGQVLTAGFHSYSGSRRGSEVANAQGKSWLWYLQNRHYPYDATDPNKYLGGDLLPYRNNLIRKPHIEYQAYDHPGVIIDDLLSIVQARPNGLVGLHWGLPNAGPKQYFEIQMADTETIFDKIKQLSDMGTSGEGEDGGFHFRVNPDKEFKIYFPSRYPKTARTDPGSCIWTFDDLVPPTEIIEVEFQNNGPQMTHILANGSGTAVRNPYRSYGASDDTQNIFRRWDGTASWSDVQDAKTVTSLAQMHYSAAMYPAITLPLKVKPEAIPGFWDTFKPGLAVWVNLDFEIRRVQQGFKINAMHCTVDNEGNEEVDLEVEQIMPLGRVGINQG